MSIAKKSFLTMAILLVVVFALSGVALAGTVGKWKIYSGQTVPRISAYSYFTGTVTQTRTDPSGFIINVETTGTNPGYIIRENTAAAAYMQVLVQYKQDSNTYLDASSWKTVYHNTRTQQSYNYAYGSMLGQFRLRMYNHNGFNIQTVGTWKPDNA